MGSEKIASVTRCAGYRQTTAGEDGTAQQDRGKPVLLLEPDRYGGYGPLCGDRVYE